VVKKDSNKLNGSLE